MRRVVIDTNVLVAALIHPAGFCGRLLDLVVDGAVEVCIDNRILAEYAEVLSRRKFHLAPDKIQVTLDFFRQSSTPSSRTPSASSSPTPMISPSLRWRPPGTRYWSQATVGTSRKPQPEPYGYSVRLHASKASKHTPDPSASA